MDDICRQTIADFGEQWQKFHQTDGWYGSRELLASFIAPYDVCRFSGRRVLDLGAGTGRFVRGLLEFGAKHVVALEPSEAYRVILETIPTDKHQQVSILQITGDNIPENLDLDQIISIGVIHHIPEPLPVVAAAYRALKPGGEFIVWLYGREGNGLYLALLTPLRWISKYLSFRAKNNLAAMLTPLLGFYIRLCRFIPLPLHDYMVNILDNIPPEKRRVVIYDQLSPAYAHYYTRAQAQLLLTSQPFIVELHHRQGYSWVGICRKPGA